MIPDQVEKRDGRVVDFDESNIIYSIQRALTGTKTSFSAQLLYDLLEVRYLFNYPKNRVHVEEVQNFVEQVLMKEGLYEVARAFITYRTVS